jgi:integrase/recombinase XerC
MVTEFLQYIQYEKNYSSHTVLSYHTDLLQFCEFHGTTIESFNYSEIKSVHIQQWIISLMQANVSARSLSRKISTLKSYWKFLLRRGYTLQNPTLKIILPKTKKSLPAFFKESEMENVLDETFLTSDFESIRDLFILKLFYVSGIRRSELIFIKDVDVDVFGKTIKVTGKRNKQRVIPISDSMIEDIERYLKARNKEVGQTEFFFARRDGKPLYPKLVYNLVHRSMSEVSTLQKRSPHVLRHTFATTMLNRGADINAVKELLGHSSLAATQVYTHTSFDELNNIYKQAHPRAK